MTRHLIIATLGAVGLAAAAATEPHTSLDSIGAACDAGSHLSCVVLAVQTEGQCASPHGVGFCQYDSLTLR